MRFQTIAPIKAHRIAPMVTMFVSTIPFPTVDATAVPVSAPVRLKNAARPIAWRGVNTLVETTVAIAFAASWKPLMYSNVIAAAMTRRKRVIARVRNRSGIFEHDLQDDVSGVAATVDHFFEQLVNVAQKNDVLRLVFAVV